MAILTKHPAFHVKDCTCDFAVSKQDPQCVLKAAETTERAKNRGWALTQGIDIRETIPDWAINRAEKLLDRRWLWLRWRKRKKLVDDIAAALYQVHSFGFRDGVAYAPERLTQDDQIRLRGQVSELPKPPDPKTLHR